MREENENVAHLRSICPIKTEQKQGIYYRTLEGNKKKIKKETKGKQDNRMEICFSIPITIQNKNDHN